MELSLLLRAPSTALAGGGADVMANGVSRMDLEEEEEEEEVVLPVEEELLNGAAAEGA